jgi:hypothetical protein
METEKLKVERIAPLTRRGSAGTRKLGPPSWAARRGTSAGGQPESEQAGEKLRAECRRMHEQV